MRIALFILVQFLFLDAYAQQHMNVKVCDTTKSPVTYVLIELQRSSDSAVIIAGFTDTLGVFDFDIADSIKMPQIHVSAMGFREIFYKIKETDLQAHSAEIRLLQDQYVLGDVVVSGSRPLITKKADKLIFNLEQSTITKGTSGWDVIKKTPLVMANEEGDIRLKGMEGVTVMINGRLERISKEQLFSYLKSIPGESIAKIEVITSPGAKYEAEGIGGIINVVLKKNLKHGFTGSVIAGYEQSRLAKFNGNLNLNYRSEKLNAYGTFSGNTGKFYNEEFLDQIYLLPNQNQYNYHEGTITNTKRNNFIQHLGLDYYLNPNHTISFMLDGGQGDKQKESRNNTLFSTAMESIDSTIASNPLRKSNNYSLACNVNYNWKIDTLGTALTFNMERLYSSTPNENSNTVFYQYDANGNLKPNSPFQYLGSAKNNTLNYNGSIDFVKAFRDGYEWSSGAKYIYTLNNNDYTQIVKKNNDSYLDTNASNNYKYQEKIASLYTSLSKSFDKVTINAGLRLEQTHANGTSRNENQDITLKYLKVFPSIFLQYNASEKYTYGLSYVTRISRPPFNDFNPSRTYVTPYSYYIGNPFLQPSYSNNFEFSVVMKQRYYFALTFNHTRNFITQIPYLDNYSLSYFYKVQNVKSSINYGAVASLPFNFTSWWETNNTIMVNYNAVSLPYQNGTFNQSSFFAFLGSNQIFKICKKQNLSAELNIAYQTPGANQGAFELGRYFETGVTFRKGFWNNNAYISLLFNDIFNGTYTTTTTKFERQSNYSYGFLDRRSIKCSFSYNFGRTTIEKPKERKSSTDIKDRL